MGSNEFYRNKKERAVVLVLVSLKVVVVVGLE